MSSISPNIISLHSCNSQQNTMFFFALVCFTYLLTADKEPMHEILNHYLRKVLRSPACVIATSVLVTEVPMLVPIMIGTATWTESTAEAHNPLYTTSECVHAVCVYAGTHIQRRPC